MVDSVATLATFEGTTILSYIEDYSFVSNFTLSVQRSGWTETAPTIAAGGSAILYTPTSTMQSNVFDYGWTLLSLNGACVQPRGPSTHGIACIACWSASDYSSNTMQIGVEIRNFTSAAFDLNMNNRWVDIYMTLVHTNVDM